MTDYLTAYVLVGWLCMCMVLLVAPPINASWPIRLFLWAVCWPIFMAIGARSAYQAAKAQSHRQGGDEDPPPGCA